MQLKILGNLPWRVASSRIFGEKYSINQSLVLQGEQLLVVAKVKRKLFGTVGMCWRLILTGVENEIFQRAEMSWIRFDVDIGRMVIFDIRTGRF